jgi:hypothetical protein
LVTDVGTAAVLALGGLAKGGLDLGTDAEGDGFGPQGVCHRTVAAPSELAKATVAVRADPRRGGDRRDLRWIASGTPSANADRKVALRRRCQAGKQLVGAILTPINSHLPRC